MVEIAGTRFRAIDRHPSGWWIHTEGLDDWWDSPDTRFDDVAIPDGDGSFDPPEVFMAARMFRFRGRHEAVSALWAEREIRTWAAGLAKLPDLGVRVYTGDRWLSLRNAKVRGRVRVREITETISEFEIPMWAADPRKYGEPVTFRVTADMIPEDGLHFPLFADGTLAFGALGSGGFGAQYFEIANQGLADFWPVFRVSGPSPGFTIVSDEHTLRFVGTLTAEQTVTLSPYAGGRAVIGTADVSHNLTEAAWVSVGPQMTRGYAFVPDEGSGAGMTLTVEHPEGAWW